MGSAGTRQIGAKPLRKLMAEVFFYELGQKPLAAVLSAILLKSLASGWRVAVRGTKPERMSKLDVELWRSPKDGFLPHGMLGGDFDSHQPILLSAEPSRINSPDVLLAVDGSEIDPEEVNGFKRVSLIFNGADPNELSSARSQWTILKKAGVPMQYWAEEGGRWVRRTRTAGDGNANA